MRGRGEVEGNDLCLNRVEVGKVGGGRRGRSIFIKILSWWESEYFCLFGRVVGQGKGLSLAINASYTPPLVFKRRIQFLLITK